MRSSKGFLFLSLALFLFSCTAKELTNKSAGSEKINYSIIYIINGDGDYLYHDENGKPHNADEDKLNEAITVAKNCLNGEVFIFHQEEKSRFLIFHLDDGEFYYFRNGKLMQNEGYKRSDSPELYQTELGLFEKFESTNKSIKKYLLYFGHEIPEFGGKEYFDSYPEVTFNINTFSKAVDKFEDGFKFNMLVLSTCHNGTPGVISKLSPYSDYIIASPEDLHLSYIDTKYLETLCNSVPTDFQFAEKFAETAFESLEKRTNTIITIVLYDTQKTSKFLNSIKGNYRSLVAQERLKEHPEFEYIDLNEEPALFGGNFSSGVKVFYRPPLFGINKNKISHSGWELIVSK